MSAPQLLREADTLRPQGDWSLRALTPLLPPLRAELAALPPTAQRWDLSGIERLDSFGARLLWQAWGLAWPADAVIPPGLRPTLERIAEVAAQPAPPPQPYRFGDGLVAIGRMAFAVLAHVQDFLVLLGQLALDWLRMLPRPHEWPLREYSANLFKVGARALPVAGLVGFLIGVVLSYLSALQLKTFGADIFIVNILGLGIIRELGPVLISVLVAGRSGSAMTAQLGVMRVTEEIDALAVMGISRHVRLVLPKVLALATAMPLLVIWTSACALAGGMVSANLELGLSYTFFLQTLPRVVPIENLYIALGKGTVFGILIALVACHYGLRVKPNTESLSSNTTASVVTAITLVILADAVFAIATRSIGVRV